MIAHLCYIGAHNILVNQIATLNAKKKQHNQVQTKSLRSECDFKS